MMGNIKRRVSKLEKEVAKKKNPLYEIRKDLKPILELKREADLINSYSNRNSIFNVGNKKQAKIELCNDMKKLIIELGEKYKGELHD